MTWTRALQVLPAVQLLNLVGLACLCWGNLLWLEGACWRAGAVDVAGLVLAHACRSKEEQLRRRRERNLPLTEET